MNENPKSILFAEHEPVIAEIIAPLLRNKGYRVNIAKNSNVLFEILSSNHPDLIVIDSSLPEPDGMTICKMLKADFLTSYIPLIVLMDKKNVRKKMLEIEHGIDDYLIKPPDPIDLEIRIEMALRRTEHNVRANALTKLPGNREIERITRERMRRGNFSFAYIDIDNFKYFNDAYGYLKGDSVIIQLAHIISMVIKKLGNSEDFVGHIGGDDFVLVTTTDKERVIASKIITEFDRLAIYHYKREDRLKRFLLRRDRSGVVRKIPLMSISIAIVNNENIYIHNMIELTEIAFEIKKYLKALPGSNYLVNRRSDEEPIQGIRQSAGQPQDLSHGYANRIKKISQPQVKPLGQLLLENGLITEDQLNDALNRHWLTAQRLGQIVVNMGFTTKDHVDRMLITQKESTSQ